MSKNHLEIMVPVHGSLFHSVCILITKIICNERGYRLRDPEIFSRLHKSPGIPDVYVSYSFKGKDDYGHTRTFEQAVCIEIETNATAASILMKNEQYTRPGLHTPIIIDMNKGFETWKSRQIAKGVSYSSDIDWVKQYIDNVLIL